MGAFHSVTENPPYRYLGISRLQESRCCRCCGTVYHQPGIVHNAQPHYPSVLCGIWLIRSDEVQSPEHTKHGYTVRNPSPISSRADEFSFDGVDSSTVLSTKLPRRKAPPSKPAHVAATLLKHTDFTKNERSALKRGFFSVMNVSLGDTSDYSQLEGCHIHGCLFVEHGNLVFQAVDCRARLPSLLTMRKHVTSTLPTRHSTDFNSTNYRLRSARGSDAAMGFPDSVCSSKHSIDVPCRESHPTSLFFTLKRTRHKLLAYLRDAYALPPKGKFSCRNCHPGMNFGSFSYPSSQLTGMKVPHNLRTRNSASVGSRSGVGSLPPPPLRLSWPLFTLRRFGFYENSLFKLESGRRAPRGEGHYLFVIKGLKEFRQHFEQYVHRRKSISPSMPTQVTHPHLSFRGDPFDQKDAASFNSLANSSPNLSPPGYCTQQGLQSCHPDSHAVTPPKLRNTHSREEKTAKYQRSSDLNHYPSSYARCQRWSMFPTKVATTNESSSFVNSVASNSSTLPTRSFNVEESSPDIVTLPDPPHPPIMSFYDNVGRAHSYSRESSNKLNSSMNKPGITREWLNSLSTQTPGRVYASRRAMTTFIHSDQCARMDGLPSVDVSSNSPRSRTLRSTEQPHGLHPRASVRSHLSLPRPPLRHSGSTAILTRGARTNNVYESRHTSLPTPVLPTGAMTTTGSNKERKPSTSDFSDSDAALTSARLVLGTDSDQPPYYNLHSPEALFQIGRSNSLTHPTNCCHADPPVGKMKRCTSVPHSSSSDQVKSSLRIRPWLMVNPDCTCSALAGRHTSGEKSVDAPSQQQQQQQTVAFIQGTTESEDPHLEVREVGPEHSRCPLGTLHYASLDFGRTLPDTVVEDEIPNSLPHTSYLSNRSPTSCSAPGSHDCTYGTLVSRSALTSHGRVRSFSSLETGGHNVNVESAGSDLPTNYVAICQLQTLAMRAVLNATT